MLFPCQKVQVNFFKPVIMSSNLWLTRCSSETTSINQIAIYMDTECHQLQHHSCMLEHRYCRTQSPANRQAWVEHEYKRHWTYRDIEQHIRITDLLNSLNSLINHWQSMSTLLGSCQQTTAQLNYPLAQDLLNFFNEKLAAVHDTVDMTPSTSLPPAPVIIDEFEILSADDIEKS